jgi:hypothetical protein
MLGVMHNWIEGVLQHHAQNKWGIGADRSMDTDADATLEDSDFFAAASAGDTISDSDAILDTIEDEIEALQAESQVLQIHNYIINVSMLRHHFCKALLVMKTCY